MNYVAFFAAIKHEHSEYVYNTIKKYDVGDIIIGLETSIDSHVQTNGEHMHFCVQMTEQTYHSICKVIFKTKFKLRGQAKDGQPRQYGKVKDIKDLNLMIAYTIKDGNIITNIPDERIEEYKKLSYKKTPVKKDILEELFTHLDKTIKYQTIDSCDVEIQVIGFLREHYKKSRKAITASMVSAYANKYRLYGTDLISDEDYYNRLFRRI